MWKCLISKGQFIKRNKWNVEVFDLERAIYQAKQMECGSVWSPKGNLSSKSWSYFTVWLWFHYDQKIKNKNNSNNNNRLLFHFDDKICYWNCYWMRICHCLKFRVENCINRDHCMLSRGGVGWCESISWLSTDPERSLADASVITCFPSERVDQTVY